MHFELCVLTESVWKNNIESYKRESNDEQVGWCGYLVWLFRLGV
jgi:hypothetical protein